MDIRVGPDGRRDNSMKAKVVEISTRPIFIYPSDHLSIHFFDRFIN